MTKKDLLKRIEDLEVKLDKVIRLNNLKEEDSFTSLAHDEPRSIRIKRYEKLELPKLDSYY